MIYSPFLCALVKKALGPCVGGFGDLRRGIEYLREKLGPLPRVHGIGFPHGVPKIKTDMSHAILPVHNHAFNIQFGYLVNG